MDTLVGGFLGSVDFGLKTLSVYGKIIAVDEYEI